MRLQALFVILFALLGASSAFHRVFEHAHDGSSLSAASWTSESSTLAPTSTVMTSNISSNIAVATLSSATTLSTTTHAAALSAAVSTTSDFVLNVKATGAPRGPPPSDSSTTLALAIVIPLIALFAFISAIVFRMYRSRKEREEAAAAEAARAKTKAIEQQISDMESWSESYDLEKYRLPADMKNLGDVKDIPIDIPIELEAEEPEKRRHRGL